MLLINVYSFDISVCVIENMYILYYELPISSTAIFNYVQSINTKLHY
jgi:hypothetical protein